LTVFCSLARSDKATELTKIHGATETKCIAKSLIDLTLTTPGAQSSETSTTNTNV
ncbi:hypothetical protein QQF64_020122, partial [Cirrhinus molitorella]